MARIAEVISTERDADGVLTVRADPGGGAVVSCDHYGDIGDDSVPLRGDYVAIEDSAGTGAEQVTGYHDPANPGVAEPGEVRRYSRNADGEIVAELWLKRDGSVELRSLNGQPFRIITTGPVILDSPDVRLSDAAGAQVARVGDIVVGTSTAPGAPFAGSIISGSTKVKA